MVAQEVVETNATPDEPATSAGRRMSLVTVDQGLSSLSNLLVLVFVAHVLTPADFGRFSLLFVVYAVGQAAVRSAVSVPVLVHPADAHDHPRAPLGAGVLLGLVASLLCLLAAGALWLLDDPTAPAAAVLGGCLFLLLIHDVGRYLAFARAVPGKAIVLDLIWLVLAIGGFVAADRVHADSLAAITLVWAGAGGVAALWVFAQYGVPRGHDLTLAWLGTRWSFVWRSLVSNVATQGVGLFGATLAALVSNPVTVAVVRASLLVGRPSATVQAGVGASTAADVAREEPADGGTRLLVRALVISLVFAVLNLVGLLLLPDVIGRLVLGEVWPLVEPLLLPVGLFGIAAAVHTAVQAVLVGRHEMTRVLRVEIAGAALAVVCLVGGAAMGGAAGALWGTLVGQTIASLGWLLTFAHYLRHRHDPPTGRHRAHFRDRREARALRRTGEGVHA